MKEKITCVIPLGEKRKLYSLDSINKQQEKINYIVERGDNPSRNRNKGATKSKTPLIAFINAHSILPSDWSKKVSKFFEKHKEIDIVGGPQLTPQNQNFFGRATGYALSSRFGSAEVSSRYSPNKLIYDANERYLTTANLICRAEVLKSVNFDENIYPGEDPKFIFDCKKKGLKVAYSPDIFVYHIRRSNSKEFMRQIFNYGFKRPYKENIFQTLKNPSFLVPSIFLIYLALFGLLSTINLIFMAPLALYIFLLIVFSIYSALKNKEIISISILPIIFFMIHVSYGLGFIYGTLRRIFYG